MHRFRRRRSFTLIETVASLVILSIAVPAMLWNLSESHRRRVDPALMTTASWLAHEKLEDVLADANCPGRGYDWVVASRYPRERRVAGFPAYARRVQVVETGIDLVSTGAGCKTITVEVQYRDSRRQQRTMRMAGVITDQTP